MNQNERTSFTLRLSERSLRRCKSGMELSGCRSRNEFIERAIDFYSGYIATENHLDFLSDVILSAINGTVGSMESRLARMLFKVAVELAKLEQMLATVNDMDEETLRRLHVKCVYDVKKINGIIRMEDAVKYQRGEID